MGRAFLALVISLTILLSSSPVWASKPSRLEQRQEVWPAWNGPAALPRPSNSDDLIYPAWFEGVWTVINEDLDDPTGDLIKHQARFQADGQGRIVGDRAFNALSIGTALLGDQLLRVEDDPNSANRQMAQLKGDLRLETKVTNRDQSSPDDEAFIADEIVLQILHLPGPPRLSRVETLSRYQRCSNQIISAEQWQARYPAPGQSMSNKAISSHHFKLTMQQEGNKDSLANHKKPSKQNLNNGCAPKQK